MLSLPLELQQQIIAELLPPKSLKQVVKVPNSRDKERNDVYNVRLICECLRAAASQAFIWVLEDVPTQCREGVLHNLASLLELPDISSKFTCLTLNAYRLFPIDPSVQEFRLLHGCRIRLAK
jgi:hypothetical protein